MSNSILFPILYKLYGDVYRELHCTPIYIPMIRYYKTLSCAVAVRTVGWITSLLFLSFSAWNATSGFVGKTFGCEELLFPGSEGKGSSTIGTFNRFISVTHRWPPLFNSWLEFRSPETWKNLRGFRQGRGNLNWKPPYSLYTEQRATVYFSIYTHNQSISCHVKCLRLPVWTNVGNHVNTFVIKKQWRAASRFAVLIILYKPNIAVAGVDNEN